jgi:hypothetical protein
MTLTSGRIIGRRKVTAETGKRGMSEVHRARQLKTRRLKSLRFIRGAEAGIA